MFDKVSDDKVVWTQQNKYYIYVSYSIAVSSKLTSILVLIWLIVVSSCVNNLQQPTVSSSAVCSSSSILPEDVCSAREDINIGSIQEQTDLKPISAAWKHFLISVWSISKCISVKCWEKYLYPSVVKVFR